MKYYGRGKEYAKRLSLPVRGAWIEMLGIIGIAYDMAESLPVRGAWIEILTWGAKKYASEDGRSPCGERGLKCSAVKPAFANVKVAPRAGSVD